MARLRSMGEEGKGGFPPCNLLGGFVGQHPELPLLLSSSEQKKVIQELWLIDNCEKTPGATDQLTDTSLSRCNISFKRP